MWERACSRKRLHAQHRCWCEHRFREQARSHSKLWRAHSRYRPARAAFTTLRPPLARHGSPWRGRLRSTRRAPGPHPCGAGR
ncbi:hypothetical protein BVK86_12030 [Pseudomonas reinekei]|uniref:Uncharacterized protein n=1 Tax=Pseudomonas reinekei TaxID=395598 RepID=A0A1Q9WW70_PSERE|nr:hypothetical protein F7R15_18900 [Pseudomonas reinekei]OLU03032.1 hypothetical protein BVK86_12030 [Pseudomonas reinekei]RZO07216.1 hypothetical protein EKG40_15865 [Pseudomonas moorei]